MTEGVIDALEVIAIDDRQPRGMARGIECEMLFETTAIGDIRQGIDQHHLFGCLDVGQRTVAFELHAAEAVHDPQEGDDQVEGQRTQHQARPLRDGCAGKEFIRKGAQTEHDKRSPHNRLDLCDAAVPADGRKQAVAEQEGRGKQGEIVQLVENGPASAQQGRSCGEDAERQDVPQMPAMVRQIDVLFHVGGEERSGACDAERKRDFAQCPVIQSRKQALARAEREQRNGHRCETGDAERTPQEITAADKGIEGQRRYADHDRYSHKGAE